MESEKKEASEPPTDGGGLRWWLCWMSLGVGFSAAEDEQLYSAYTQQQRMRCVPRLFAFGTALQLYSFLVPGDSDIVFAYVIAALTTILNIMLVVVYAFLKKSRIYICYILHITLWVQLLYNEMRRFTNTYNELLGWAAILQYLCVTSLPFPVFYHLFCVAFTTGCYTLVQIYVVHAMDAHPEDFAYQIGVNVVLLAGAALLGLISYLIRDGQQRSSYLETKRSLGDKLTIEQQSKEQERLLLSVLPEHVAVQMRKDLGLIDTQFKKIYMSRHENVSILYADIVGFTAISSTYSAQDLVSILNELFARFDRLAEKYQQLRIKILGDCYYCISGAPVERPDHAVLCVHMGLSMVKAIKYVQQTTKSPVDMRVGIHTGAVLAGVLGQRQWQFDVYSRDVELANKMESSGKAGRVHISEVTLGYLNDEFEVEPAHGERREEMLRQAGIKTYFIVKVLKPFSGEEKCLGEDGEEAPDTLSDLRDDDEDSVLSPQDEKECDEQRKIYLMLKEELVNRDDDKELADATTIWLTFKSPEEELAFAMRADPCPPFSLMPPLLLAPAVFMLFGFAAPGTHPFDVVYVALIVLIVGINIVYVHFFLLSRRKKSHTSHYYTVGFGILQIILIILTNTASLTICGILESYLDDGLNEDALSHQGARRCRHPSYFYETGASVLLSCLWVSPLSTAWRAALLLGAGALLAAPPVASHALRHTHQYQPFHVQEDAATLTYVLAELHYTRHILTLIFLFVVLVIYDRYLESEQRARHSRGRRMRAQAEQAADLRRRNTALVHNVLPPHVAQHFMGARHHHRDLYSQSYAEVGVLFASMPNFSEFYSEETVNNQGLECLRFLNEVISDFDLLLEDPKYCNDIIKIKTISSSYMAASGLNPKQQIRPSDSVLVRWEHLANLVEFALELQAVLAAINEQSFNHFVLRMGVNHGPITAGVIGARKPHYDIWGNTVNVASRMESTGKAGCIQVTEETCHILQQFGYTFEQRGLVAVKGKGQLMTYYLQGRSSTPPPSRQAPDRLACNLNPKEASVVNGGAQRSPPPPQRDGADQRLLDMV